MLPVTCEYTSIVILCSRVRGKISHGDVSMRTVIDRDTVFVRF